MSLQLPFPLPFQLPDVPANASELTYGIAGIAAAIIVFSKLANSRKLNAIPTVGSAGWLGSWRDGLTFFTNGRNLIQQGYEKHKGAPFKVAEYFRWIVIITSRKQLDEMRRAPDDELSFLEATNERISFEHTMGREIYFNPYHIEIVRSQLTRNIGVLYPEILDEIVNSFEETLDLKGNEWKTLTAMNVIQQVVCRTSNRLFVGLPLCRDPDWIDLNIRYTIDVAKAGAIIGVFPKIFKPFVALFLTTVQKSTRLGMKLIGPMIEERLKYLEEYGDEWTDKPNDLLSWLLEEAEGEERTMKNLTTRVLAVNFAAIHTSSNSFAHALFYLAANPQYVKALREEVETITEKEGWSKASMGKLRKLDSFLKESQRMKGIGALSLTRKALTDFTFSDGTFIPKGTLLAAPSRSLHFDDEFYENAESFDPFRFSEMREEDGEGVKHQFVSTSIEYLPFGHGKHACPGRFFAANELKSMLAHIIVTYDVKLEDNPAHPSSLWINTSILANPRATIMFRRRVD